MVPALLLYVAVGLFSWLVLWVNCNQHRCEWVNVSSGTSLPESLRTNGRKRLLLLLLLLTDSMKTLCTCHKDSHLTLTMLLHYLVKFENVFVCACVAGRTHQLRVHCCTLGHRVIGDYMYSDRQDASPRRMMLHAIRLVVPMKHEHISITTCDPFTSDLDPDWHTSHIFNSYEEFCRQS